MLTRRQFLTTACLSASLSPLSSQSATHNSQLASLDETVIQKVNQLTAGKKTSLTLLYPKGCLANLQPVVDRFSKQTDIHFKLQETGVNDINSTIVFSTAKQEYTFDIALPATFGLVDLVNAGALAPLSEFAKRHEPAEYKRDQLYDYGDYVKNTLYGYQTDGDTYLMFYNRSMMDNAENKKKFKETYGYELAIPSTWKQLDEMIQFFHKPEKQQYGGCLFRVPGYGAWEWWSRFHAKGYFPLDDNGNPQINNKAGVEALQEMVNISQYLHPNTATDSLFDNWKTFSDNQTFCNIGWGGSQKFFNNKESKVRNNLYFSPAPGGKINNNVVSCPIFNWGWNYVVSSLCPEKEIAYLFTLYACSPTMSTLAVQQDGYFDPFREEHYANAEIQNIYSKEFLSAHKTSMENSIPDFYIQNQSNYLSVLQENIYLAYNGSLTPKQALDITATEWKLETAKIGQQKQLQNWLELKNSYPKIFRENLR